MTPDFLGLAYAWQDGGQWFHAASAAEAPTGSAVVQRYLEAGEIVLYMDSGYGTMIRGAKPWLTGAA